MSIKKILLRGISGIPLGIFICTTIGLIISIQQGRLIVIRNMDTVKYPLMTYIIQYIASGVIGFVFAASSEIFKIDRWSIAKQIIVHLLITLIVFLPCSIIAGWVDPDLLSIISYLIAFVLIYLIIWAIQYFTWKKRIDKLNKKLQER